MKFKTHVSIYCMHFGRKLIEHVVYIFKALVRYLCGWTFSPDCIISSVINLRYSTDMTNSNFSKLSVSIKK